MPITRGAPRVLDLKTFSTDANGSNAGAKGIAPGGKISANYGRFYRKWRLEPGPRRFLDKGRLKQALSASRPSCIWTALAQDAAAGKNAAGSADNA